MDFFAVHFVLGLFRAPLVLPWRRLIVSAPALNRLRRKRVVHLIALSNGLFGKVVADLIAEGQANPSILKELYESHIRPSRAYTVADIERGIASGEFVATTDPELLIDAIFSPVYLRLLLRRPH